MAGALMTLDGFKKEMALMRPNILKMLPSNVKPEKFEALVVAAVSGNPKLLECTRASLWRACVHGAELGLSLNPTMGEADILPVWSKGGSEAQFRPRYKGLMKLARQSGEVTSIRSELVYENDEFEVVGGLRPDIIHKHAKGDRGALTHAYCVWTLKGVAEPQFEVMDRAQIMRIKARSESGKRNMGPWVTDEEEMWRKTVVRRASKYMPISCEAFQNAVAMDNLAEVGHDYEVEDGEVIDVTAAEDEVREITGTAQVDEIEASLADEGEEFSEPVDADDEPAIPLVDFGPTDNWQTWCVKAGNAVKALPKDARAAWAKKHEQMLVEAAESRPTAVKRIRDLVNGAE